MSTLKTNNIQHVDRSDPSIIISTDGGVSIAGTLTYEDVTNIDAVGIVTGRELINAQKQIHVGTGVSVKAGGINVTAGITTVQALQATTGTFSGNIVGDDSTEISGINNITIAGDIIHSGDDTKIRFPANDQIQFETAGSERLKIDSSGSATFTTPGGDNAVLVKGDTYTSVRVQSARDSVSDHAMFQMLGSRGTNASPTIIQNNDKVGTINARAYDGNSYGSISDITFEVDGAPGDGDMPGRIVFRTSASGSESPTERLRIDSSGNVGINEDPTIARFQVKSAQLGGTAGNTQEVVRLHSPDVSNTTSYRFTNYRVSDGTSHSSSELRFRRHVDATDMGYFGLGDGYASIGYGTAEKVRIQSNGNIGIGTGTAGNNLHIYDSSVAAIQFTDGGAAVNNRDWINVANGTEFYWQAIAENGSGGGNLFKLVRSGNDINSFEALQAGTTWFKVNNTSKVVQLYDNAELYFGTNLDMRLVHNDTNGVFTNYKGDLYIENDLNSTTEKIYIRPRAGESSIECIANGAVHLYHDGASDSSYYSRYDGATIRNNNAQGTKDCNVDLIGRVDGNVQLHFYADDNTDNNKKFKIKGDGGSEQLQLQGYYTGSWTSFLTCSKGANNNQNLKIRAGKGGIRFDDGCEDYRDIDGDGHLFRRDGQAQIGVDDFLYIHDISTSDTNNRLRHRFETNSGHYDAEGNINANQSLDFAEYFEWSDGNPNNEDRIGHTVSVDGLTGKIKIAEAGEPIIGVISGTAGFIGGGHAFSWRGRFKHDEWGREVFEELKDENGNVLYSDAETRAQIVKTNRIETEEYDSSLENSYVPRSLRKEWDVVGLVGQIRVRKTAVIPNNWIKLKEIDSVKDLYLVK